jgi:hypothetical protein
MSADKNDDALDLDLSTSDELEEDQTEAGLSLAGDSEELDLGVTGDEVDQTEKSLNLTSSSEELEASAVGLDLGQDELETSGSIEGGPEQEAGLGELNLGTSEDDSNVSMLDLSEESGPTDSDESELAAGLNLVDAGESLSEISKVLTTGEQEEEEGQSFGVSSGFDQLAGQGSPNDDLMQVLSNNSVLKEKLLDYQQQMEELKVKLELQMREKNEKVGLIEERIFELEVVNKRLEKQIAQTLGENELLKEKLQLIKRKNQKLEIELKNVNKLDSLTKNGNARNKQLEEKYSLLQEDSAMQIKTRERKIMELKRKVDLLEFDQLEGRKNEQNLIRRIQNLEVCLKTVTKSLGGVIQDIDRESDKLVGNK